MRLPWITLGFCAALATGAMVPNVAVSQDIIRVGAPLPLTGPLSPEGVKQKQGYDLWAETANAKGGSRSTTRPTRLKSSMLIMRRTHRARYKPPSGS